MAENVVQLFPGRAPPSPPAVIPPRKFAVSQPNVIGFHRIGTGWIIVARSFMCGMPLKMETQT
jgi:hypothetical protein